MKKTILLSCLIFVFCSCDNEIEIENSIQGKWSVTQIFGGFSPTKNYDEEDVTWFFDLENKTVTILNNVDVFNTLHIPSFANNQGGTYSFEIKIENNIEYVVVDDRKGSIKLTNNELTIDYGIALDDIAYNFKR